MLENRNDPPLLIAPGGHRFPVAPGRSTIGRDVNCDVCLSDPTVGRQHALIDATASLTLRDLNSTNGTWVNGRRLGVGDVVPLHDGDVLRLASTELRFSAPHAEHTTQIDPRSAAGPPTPAVGVPQMNFGDQNAEAINAVIGNNNQFLKTVVEQRESFLREIAASRTRARWLTCLGFLLFLGGGGTYMWTIIKTMSATGRPDQQQFEDFFGDRVGGVPIGLIGFAVAAVGAVMMLVGIVLHISATLRVDDVWYPNH